MRISTFDEKGELKVEDESVFDALIDVINYIVLIRGLIVDAEVDECTKREIDRAGTCCPDEPIFHPNTTIIDEQYGPGEGIS